MHCVRLLGILIFILIFQACGDSEMEEKANDLSNSFCDCLETAEIDNPSAYKAVALGNNKTLAAQMDSCTVLLKERLLEDIKSFEKADQTEFLKAFLKAVIDSDCGVNASEAVPYDLLNLWYEEQSE